MKIDFAGGLRAILKDRELTIKAFADLVGVQDKNLHTQFKRQDLRLSSLSKWAEALNMQPSELLREMEKKQVAVAQVASHNSHNTTQQKS